MKLTFKSLDEFLSGCSTSALRNHVSSVLRDDKYIRWGFVSCSVEGNVCRSEFSSPIENSGRAYHLSCELNQNGEYWYTSIVDSMMV